MREGLCALQLAQKSRRRWDYRFCLTRTRRRGLQGFCMQGQNTGTSLRFQFQLTMRALIQGLQTTTAPLARGSLQGLQGWEVGRERNFKKTFAHPGICSFLSERACKRERGTPSLGCICAALRAFSPQYSCAKCLGKGMRFQGKRQSHMRKRKGLLS